MKILHLISSINFEGGGPVELLRVMSLEFHDMGIEGSMDILCCDAPEDGEHAAQYFGNSMVYFCGPAYLKYAYAPKIIPWLKNHLKNYDALVVHGVWQYISIAASRCAIAASVPYYVVTHGMLDPWFARKYPIKHLKKSIYWKLIESNILKGAKKVIFTSQDEFELARTSFSPFKVNPSIVSYGVRPLVPDLNAINHFYDTFPSIKNKRNILFLSRIHEKKGCDILIDAFAKIVMVQGREDLHLIMAGPGGSKLLAALKSQAKKLGIDGRITWTGMLDFSSKTCAYYCSEVFILPTHQENFGIVIAEALSCSIPVLISNKTNIWRDIEESKTGYVDEDTFEGTVRNLERWLLTTDEEIRVMRSRCRPAFNDRYSTASSLNSFLRAIGKN